MDLTRKKILFIGPVFHDYHSQIINKLEENGALITFIPERSYGLKFKIINNYFKPKLKLLQQDHYKKSFEALTDSKFDILLIIRGYMLDIEILEDFRKKNPMCKIIMYQWDSQKTNPFVHLTPFIDKIYSFDFKDCEENIKLQYLPLFYTEDILVLKDKPTHLEYEFLFFGGYLPERYKAVLRFHQYAKDHHKTIKNFLFLPFSSYVKSLLKGDKLNLSYISFKHMNRAMYLDLLSKSKVIVDVSNQNQTGLSMRIIEALACGKKVITNNIYLKKALLLKSERILLFDAANPDISEDFLDLPFTSPLEGVYSLNEWINILLKD